MAIVQRLGVLDGVHDGPNKVAGMFDTRTTTHFSILSIQLRHFDCIRCFVTPIQIAPNPIHSDTIWVP